MFIRLLAFAIMLAAFAPGKAAAQQVPLERLRLPPGFEIELYARVPRARSMVVMDDWGVVLVGSRSDLIHAVIDADKDGRPERVIRLFEGLHVANGIDWKDGWFYLAEQHRIVRYKAPDFKTLDGAKPEVLFEALPDDPWHGWRYARFGPDGGLYVAVGAPCNICDVKGLEGTIIRLGLKTRRPEIFASGVRNSVGFDFQPKTGVLYFTDNGADNMGDDSPPDELNYAPAKGLWFGYPYYGGGSDRTPQFARKQLPRAATFPVVEFGAHVATLGISFYRGKRFPAQYHGDAFVAEHGSWNRSIPDGYRISRVRFDKKTHKALGRETFIDGWLQADRSVWGRPVDVKNMADGSILISDDKLGAIYRVSYKGAP